MKSQRQRTFNRYIETESEEIRTRHIFPCVDCKRKNQKGKKLQIIVEVPFSADFALNPPHHSIRALLLRWRQRLFIINDLQLRTRVILFTSFPLHACDSSISADNCWLRCQQRVITRQNTLNSKSLRQRE